MNKAEKLEFLSNAILSDIVTEQLNAEHGLKAAEITYKAKFEDAFSSVDSLIKEESELLLSSSKSLGKILTAFKIVKIAKVIKKEFPEIVITSLELALHKLDSMTERETKVLAKKRMIFEGALRAVVQEYFLIE